MTFRSSPLPRREFRRSATAPANFRANISESSKLKVMRPLRLIGALGTLVVSVALLSESGCTTSGDIKPPPSSTSAAGGSGYPGTAQGGNTSVDTNTGGTAPTTGGAEGTGGMTSCSDPLLTLCSNACFDTTKDRTHCGGCNTACGTTEICTDGLCGCPASNSDANAGPITDIQSCVAGQCDDLRTSTIHCGACWNTCTPKRCIEGACGCAATDISCSKDGVACTTSDANCGCYDPLTDKNHCGSCATKCAQYEACVQGACVLDCAANNLTECDGKCVDTQKNSAVGASGVVENCGGCGISCPTDKFECVGGVCDCRAKASIPTAAHCVDPTRGDLCVDTANNPQFCGSCNVACTSGHVCENGVCVCSSTATLCGDNCYDLTSDSQHCGDCAKACGVGEHCASSACVCTAPLESCSGRCADYLTEAANCGGCGNACGKGQACTAGACQCDAGMDLCGGNCFNFQTDATHCGDCSTSCSASQTCVAGACKCGSDLTACGQACVDAQNDALNCGGCDKKCTGTQMCQGGTCKPSIVKAQTQAQADGGSMLRLFISVCNAGSASLTLTNYTLKYWYSADGAALSQEVAITYSPATPTPTASAVLLDLDVARVHADATLTLKFGATTLATGACTGGIQIEIHAQNYTGTYGPQGTGDTADYSYSSSTTLKDNPNVTIYNDKGGLVWGLEPALLTTP